MEQYLDFATDLAKRAGDLMRQNFSLGMAKQWKADASPVTETDLTINRMVIEAVQAAFPGHDVVAEEESAGKLDSEWVWICDPVDGTVPFSHGQPNFAFSLALVHSGEIVLAVTNDPMSDLLFTAQKGEGAKCNGKPIRVSGVIEGTPLIDIEDPWLESPYDWGRVRHALLREPIYTQTFWSVVFAANRVASGDLAATICGRGHIWDVAAVALLVEEAGGRATDLEGNPIQMVDPQQGFLVSNGTMHDMLLSQIAAARK